MAPMRPSSRANRAALAVSVAIVLAAVTARGAGVTPPPVDASTHYQRCLDEARRTPGPALAEAEDWRSAGGGFPAEHCAAVALFGLKRYAEAAQRLEELAGVMMQRGPDLRAGALEQAGEAWLLAGQPAKAKAAFTAALSFTPKSADLLIDRARILGEGKQFQSAVADLDAALALAPGRADALAFRASALRQLGDIDRARADADRALALAPNDVAAHLERGNIRRLQGDAAGARDDWRAVEKLAPNSPEASAASDNLATLADAK